MLDATRGPLSHSRNSGYFGCMTTGGQECETFIVFIHMKADTKIPITLACMHIHSTHVHIYVYTQTDTCTHASTSRCTAKYLIPHANCLPRVCLMDIYVSALSDTHTESNSAHQKTSDSLYHRCFYFTLIQNRHT